MLHKETIEPMTLELLKTLQKEIDLQNTYLVGGTSIALRKGYRKSVDIDLFLREDFNAEELSFNLYNKYGFHETFRRNNTLKGDINNIKLDIIKYDYNFISKPEIIENIRMLSIPDIIAMKLAVISDSGTRVKDFVDIAFLSTEYSFTEMLSFFKTKYPHSNELGPCKGLIYFDDIDHSDPVNLIGYQYDWKFIEERLTRMSIQCNKKFSEYPCPGIFKKK
ncbi:MAG: nucleotidyl transferase AbiEii/AbiGii toxin family protein [Candidatus Cryptobacteroides sp.]